MGPISKRYSCFEMMRQNIGDAAEDAACAHLKKHRYSILERNFSGKMGEIDIIAQSPNQEIIFVEVRFRKSIAFGGALESITSSKQARIRRTAEYYLCKYRLTDQPCRFDVLALSPQGNTYQIEWLENAFY